MTPLPWHEVEKTILNEERWLNDIFDFGPYLDTDSPPIPLRLSNDKMLRQIAIAIVNGGVVAREMRSAVELGLWTDEPTHLEHIDKGDERHGGHWHQTMMSIVKQHFCDKGFEVSNEPPLSLGRADLGVYKPGYQNLFVEIGTTSLLKTWFNIKNMPNTIILFIPTTSNAIEFKINDGITHDDFYV
jgi:hypothetical protein